MKTINHFYIPRFLIGLTGMADDDASIERYRNFDSNNVDEVKRVIASELKPIFFEQVPQKSIVQAKLALQYYLNHSIDWQDLYDARLLPFDSPTDPRDFFVWIWEVFFPNEDFRLLDFDDVVIDNDPEAPRRDAMAERNNSRKQTSPDEKEHLT